MESSSPSGFGGIKFGCEPVLHVVGVGDFAIAVSFVVFGKFFGGVESEWLWGISPEGIGSIGMLINFVVTLVVSRITPPPPQHVVDLVDEMRLPREGPVAS